MRRWGCALLLAGCFALGLAADGRASGQLPGSCDSWFGPRVLALICDPAGRSGGGLKIEIPGDSAHGESGTGIAQLPGSEPFQDGDRITFMLDGASAETVVAFRAASIAGVGNVVITRFDPAARRYAVEIDGEVARVATDSGQVRALPIAPPRPPLSITTETPAAAVRSFVRAIGSDGADLEVACGLLSRTTRAAYSNPAVGRCSDPLAFVLFYEDVTTHPEIVSIEAGR